MTSDQYCQERAAASGSSFYYSFLFLPPPQRQAIMALYAFCREVDDVVDECSDVGVARIKLQWWREEIERILQGNGQHPVAEALKRACDNFHLPKEYLLEIIDGMEMDLNQTRYASFKELNLYCYRVASVVGLMAAEIFGYQDRQTLKYAHQLGIAFQLTNILRDVREDAMRGRIYLPADEMARFGVSDTDLLNGNQTAQVTELMRFQADRARDYYRQAFEQLPAGDRYSQRSGLIMAEIYLATLTEIAEDDYQVLLRRTSLTPLRKLWIAWKTARREKKHQRQAGKTA